MGALTNKNFPFELRGWEIEKISFFDPTDSFGYSLKILINNNKIIQIEPDYCNKMMKNYFISNKSRHFFNILENFKENFISLNFFKKIFLTLNKVLYLFELNRLKYEKINFFYIIYENLSFDILCLLAVFKQKYFFIKLHTVYDKNMNTNLESNFLFNKIKLDNSNLCLLLNINLRFESINLNLKLKQRFLKGNFNLIEINSFSNLNFSLQFLGNTFNILKILTEGLHICCQSLKFSRNPILILQSELLRRKDYEFINLFLINITNSIKYFNINILNTSIYETGIHNINCYTNNNKFFFQYSSIYFLNFLSLKNNFFINILKINLLYLTKKNNILLIKKNYINQNSIFKIKILSQLKNYFYLPIKTFFETTEFFFNNDGLIKNSFPIFFNNKLQSNWKILRYFFNKLNQKLLFFKINFLINFNLKNRYNFLRIIFLLYISKKIISSNYILNNINSFYVNFYKHLFVLKTTKLLNTKIKFWLNDFFIGGRDHFSQNSVILIKCSNINRLQQTNFF